VVCYLPTSGLLSAIQWSVIRHCRPIPSAGEGDALVRWGAMAAMPCPSCLVQGGKQHAHHWPHHTSRWIWATVAGQLDTHTLVRSRRLVCKSWVWRQQGLQQQQQKASPFFASCINLFRLCLMDILVLVKMPQIRIPMWMFSMMI